ncbi:MAG: DNA internalization-related competence protein ComEC/Rec2 [Oscillospiraceae bacterium]|nr:DNA internalization-related competence protein ComEC/Rec2 [Oscillospiraceae bacterium]
MRRLCWFCLPFCAAVLCACLGLPFALPVGLGLTAAGILTGWRGRLPVCLLCLGAAAGLLWTQGYALLFRAPAEALAGQTAAFSATVTGFPQATSTGSYSVQVRLHLQDAPDVKVLLYTDSGEMQPGDKISGSASFSLATLVRGENVTYYESKGIFLRASTQGELTVDTADGVSPLLWPVYISQAMKQSAAALFSQDTAGLLAALLTGDKSLLSDGDYAALSRAGAAHIAAVSGLHVSFFVGLLGLFFRRRSRVGAALTVALLCLFSAVAGFTPSVVRACFMAGMALLAPMLGRETDSPTTLTAILFLLLLQNPYAIFSVSLQLSFASVAGILWASDPLYQRLTGWLPKGKGWLPRLRGRAVRFGAASLSVTVGALLLTTPLSAYYFRSVSLVAPLTNLLILWAVSLAFSVGLPVTLLGLALPGLAGTLALPVQWLARYVLAVVRLLGRLSFAALSTDFPLICAWLVFVYALLLVLYLLRYRRGVLPVCVCILTLCAALLGTRLSLLGSSLTVTMLNVGQGQCILLFSQGYTAIIDCGGNEDNAGDIAADYLQTLGISRVDLLILTHCHSDHTNGVEELMARLKVDNLILPELDSDDSESRAQVLALAEDAGAEVTLLEQSVTLLLGQTKLNLYAPLVNSEDLNENSLFILASQGEFDLLVTGDADSFSESVFLKYYDLPDIEALVAGHHGSATSTGEALLDALTPELCLISSGYNTYGHPSQQVLARLEQRDIAVYRTDRAGHVTIQSGG